MRHARPQTAATATATHHCLPRAVEETRPQLAQGTPERFPPTSPSPHQHPLFLRLLETPAPHPGRTKRRRGLAHLPSASDLGVGGPDVLRHVYVTQL